MKAMIKYLNPSGNITAVLNSSFSKDEIQSLSRDIIDKHLAEQVCIECEPKNGGDCRIEMVSGEFCGNALRAYGYYYFINNAPYEKGTLLVEISGYDKPLKVEVDTINEEAFASMPIISETRISYMNLEYNGEIYKLPIVFMDGIVHVIFNVGSQFGDIKKAFEESEYTNSEVIEDVITRIKENKMLFDKDAIGIMFVIDNYIYPYVEVKDVGSSMWESSCGSGTTAYFTYLLHEIIRYGNYKPEDKNPLLNGVYKQNGDTYSYEKIFKEPGGNIVIKGIIEDNKIKEILMGGSVEIYE